MLNWNKNMLKYLFQIFFWRFFICCEFQREIRWGLKKNINSKLKIDLVTSHQPLNRLSNKFCWFENKKKRMLGKHVVPSTRMIYWFLSKWFILLLLGSLGSKLWASKHFKYTSRWLFSWRHLWTFKKVEADILWRLQKG